MTENRPIEFTAYRETYLLTYLLTYLVITYLLAHSMMQDI